jgi:hypothetical protein
VKKGKGIHWLNIQGNHITSEGMLPLFNALAGGTQSLRKLDVSQNTQNYTEPFIKYFCKFLENNAAVFELKISGNLTDKQAKLITKSLSLNKGLELIDFGNITESQFKYITGTIQSKKLTIHKPQRFRAPKKKQHVLRNTSRNASMEKKLERLGVSKKSKKVAHKHKPSVE